MVDTLSCVLPNVSAFCTTYIEKCVTSQFNGAGVFGENTGKITILNFSFLDKSPLGGIGWP